MRVVLTGGGTGGHVYPALAIAEALRDKKRDIDIHFLGTASGIESRVVPSSGETLHVIKAGGIVGKSFSGRVSGALNAGLGVVQSLNSLRKLKPDVVVGTGGFVMAPVLLSAKLLRIPIVIQEQNSFPGFTTRKFAGSAKQVCIAYPQTEKHLPTSSNTLTGNPLRKQLVELAQASESRSLGSPPRILVTGGSLGARSINNAVADSLADLCGLAQVTWQYGRSGLPGTLDSSLVNELSASGAMTAAAFFDDMPARYAKSDMIVCRAGAMTLSEVSIFGLPALLIPFPHAAHDHQTTNAKSFQEVGAAVMITDSQLTGATLLQTCKSILSDTSKYKMMSNAMREQARPNAASEIADIVIAVSNS